MERIKGRNYFKGPSHPDGLPTLSGNLDVEGNAFSLMSRKALPSAREAQEPGR